MLKEDTIDVDTTTNVRCPLEGVQEHNTEKVAKVVHDRRRNYDERALSVRGRARAEHRKCHENGTRSTSTQRQTRAVHSRVKARAEHSKGRESGTRSTTTKRRMRAVDSRKAKVGYRKYHESGTRSTSTRRRACAVHSRKAILTGLQLGSTVCKA